MHVKYLGHDQFTYGSVLSLLTKYVLTGDQNANLARVWRNILGFYDTYAVPYQHRYLNKTSIFERVHPKLRGKARIKVVSHQADVLQEVCFLL